MAYLRRKIASFTATLSPTLTMLSPSCRIAIGLSALIWAAGCSPIQPSSKSPLHPLQMAPQVTALEVFFVRCPSDDPRANTQVWNEVDEQTLPAEVRRGLTRNGFRVGLIGNQIPPVLDELMDLNDKPPPDPNSLESHSINLEETPKVVRRYLQVRPGKRQEIVVSGIYDELPVLVAEGDQLTGRTYERAQAIYALKAYNERDGRVRVELTPELHYGDPAQRWVSTNGMFRVQTGRDRRVLENLAINATLVPGQILIVASLPNRSGSLGHHFFSEKTDGPMEQKLLLLRVAQTQHDDLLNVEIPDADDETQPKGHSPSVKLTDDGPSAPVGRSPLKPSRNLPAVPSRRAEIPDYGSSGIDSL